MTPEAIEQLLERARQAQAGFATFVQREAPTARIIDLLDDIHLAFIAADTMAIRKRVGWLGRLLGRDIDVQAEAELLRTQGPLLIHRSDELDAEYAAYDAAITDVALHVHDMQSELAETLRQLNAAPENSIDQGLHQRLQQMAALFDIASTQSLTLGIQAAQVGHRLRDVRAGLLPMLAQTGIVDAIHMNHGSYAKASSALQSLDALKRRHSTPSIGASYDAGP
ncbi:MAG: hypothetical protein Q4G62_09240 [Pseudomonadota bacterium]|nr:hypothetical protein [Pseudomonadota bacterium]